MLPVRASAALRAADGPAAPRCRAGGRAVGSVRGRASDRPAPRTIGASRPNAQRSQLALQHGLHQSSLRLFLLVPLAKVRQILLMGRTDMEQFPPMGTSDIGEFAFQRFPQRRRPAVPGTSCPAPRTDRSACASARRPGRRQGCAWWPARPFRAPPQAGQPCRARGLARCDAVPARWLPVPCLPAWRRMRPPWFSPPCPKPVSPMPGAWS